MAMKAIIPNLGYLDIVCELAGAPAGE